MAKKKWIKAAAQDGGPADNSESDPKMWLGQQNMNMRDAQEWGKTFEAKEFLKDDSKRFEANKEKTKVTAKKLMKKMYGTKD